MIKYIGDVSSADSLVLKEFAEKSKNILEAGMGASTQVMAKYTTGKLTSLETDPFWIERTKSNFDLIGIPKDNVRFLKYNTLEDIPKQEYDLVFVDLVDHLRLPFSLEAFKYLKIGGHILFHDCRRSGDFRNSTELANHYYQEVLRAEFNYLNSNITVITKREPLVYENWNIIESRENWMAGYCEPDRSFYGK